MGDPIAGAAPIEYVKVFFGEFNLLIGRGELLTARLEQERLPYAEGWRPLTQETNLLTLGSMILALNVGNGEVIPEGLEITTNTLKLAFGGYDPITGFLAHVL
jgi:hypothetical protein